MELSEETDFLASTETMKTNGGAGTELCPWHITVKPGQKIAITMYSFANWRSSDGHGQLPFNIHRPGDVCYEIAVAKEKENKLRSITACNDDRREVVIYTSENHDLMFHLVAKEMLKSVGQFLLKYKGKILQSGVDLEFVTITILIISSFQILIRLMKYLSTYHKIGLGFPKIKIPDITPINISATGFLF